MINTDENIKRFENLMSRVTREGVNELMNYIRKSDFYSAPASTRFHLACQGGLLQHSLNVYDCLMAKKSSPLWGKQLESISEESLIIISLMHDLCKVGLYSIGYKNQKTYDKDKVASADSYKIKHDELGNYIWETVPKYEIDDKFPLGHGEKSLSILQLFMRLKPEEIFAIRWHMGFSEEKSQYASIGTAMERWPIVLAVHEADLEASKLLEDIEGNRNFQCVNKE